MFLGTHTPRLDEKGRLILPAKYRDELAEGVVITKGQERCLYVWPLAEFTRVTNAMRDAQMSGKTLRDHSRVLFASASDEVPDKQGRVTGQDLAGLVDRGGVGVDADDHKPGIGGQQGPGVTGAAEGRVQQHGAVRGQGRAEQRGHLVQHDRHVAGCLAHVDHPLAPGRRG